MKSKEFHYVAPFEISNIHRVPVKQWRKWDVQARGVFNEVYGSMLSSQRCFIDPKMRKMTDDQWEAICWNAGWTAACAAN